MQNGGSEHTECKQAICGAGQITFGIDGTRLPGGPEFATAGRTAVIDRASDGLTDETVQARKAFDFTFRALHGISVLYQGYD
jgi:hypothetical protein